MKVGLYNVDSKIANLALMKIAQYHKYDDISWYRPIYQGCYDKVYASSVFTQSNKGYIRDNMVCGGTGFDLTSVLDDEIEKCQPDYSIYPDFDYSLQMFSRGCIRKCKFCVVPQKEGFIRAVDPMNLNPKGKYIDVLDNNFFANAYWRDAIKLLQKWNQPIDITQGIDARILTEEMAEALLTLKHTKQIHFAWDNPKHEVSLELEKMVSWFPKGKLMCYVLIGYWTTPKEDFYRVEKLRGYGIDPFVMPYNKHDDYQRHFARWVNHKAVFKSVSWEDYLGGKK